MDVKLTWALCERSTHFTLWDFLSQVLRGKKFPHSDFNNFFEMCEKQCGALWNFRFVVGELSIGFQVCPFCCKLLSRLVFMGSPLIKNNGAINLQFSHCKGSKRWPEKRSVDKKTHEATLMDLFRTHAINRNLTASTWFITAHVFKKNIWWQLDLCE